MITPPGEGGIAALRIAGRHSLTFIKHRFQPIASDQGEFKPFLMRYGHFLDRKGDIIDEVMAVYMPEGRSYTGKDQVEIYCHGGRQVVKLIQDEIVADGARVAEPGEFTRLAFLAGRIDLTRAEAVAELIEATTDTSFLAARDHLLGMYHEQVSKLREALIDIIAEVEASVDYPEEDLETAEQAGLLAQVDELIEGISRLAETYRGGRIINEGFRIAIAGRPNAGKSSLFNLLLKQERALVTPTPGTTRDYLSEWIELEGFKVNLIDTAGLRAAGGTVERAGQKSSRRVLESAHLVLWMIDLSKKSWKDHLGADIKGLSKGTILLVGNKIDLVADPKKALSGSAVGRILPVSCKTGRGIAGLKKAMAGLITDCMPDLTSGVVVTSARHKQKLSEALKSLKAARRNIKVRQTPELVAFDLRQAVQAIDEITGKIYNEEILGRIFSRFCVGK